MAAKPARSPKKRVPRPSKPTRRRRAARPRVRARRIDAHAKTLAIGAEPPIDRDPDHLVPEFWTRLQRVLEQLAAAGTPFRFHEGFRTVERQQWLYGSGRPRAAFGRPGAIVTNADGVTARSNHQGSGAAGSGRAADCYPLRDGRVIIPASSDPLWRAYAQVARAHGLTAGLYWPRFQDAPHCELPTG